jgi:hypothetical protein
MSDLRNNTQEGLISISTQKRRRSLNEMNASVMLNSLLLKQQT